MLEAELVSPELEAIEEAKAAFARRGSLQLAIGSLLGTLSCWAMIWHVLKGMGPDYGTVLHLAFEVGFGGAMALGIAACLMQLSMAHKYPAYRRDADGIVLALAFPAWVGALLSLIAVECNFFL